MSQRRHFRRAKASHNSCPTSCCYVKQAASGHLILGCLAAAWRRCPPSDSSHCTPPLPAPVLCMRCALDNLTCSLQSSSCRVSKRHSDKRPHRPAGTNDAAEAARDGGRGPSWVCLQGNYSHRSLECRLVLLDGRWGRFRPAPVQGHLCFGRLIHMGCWRGAADASFKVMP
jgi:hypothetical protein